MKKKFILFFVVVLFAGGTFFAFDPFFEHARAGTGDNVSGWAWSENIGWISFNCTNGGTCNSIDYGINVDSSSGNFSGYAWSENIGWIKFDPAGPYPSNPPGDNSSAVLNLNNNKVSGWARACAGAANPDCTGGASPSSGGWDGWIKTNGTSPSYGVIYNTTSKEFSGYAWGGEVIGWISFNCADLGVCSTSNYKVVANINSPPRALGLSVAKGDYCSVPSHAFSWVFSDPEDGNTQTSYNLEVAKNSGFSPVEIQASGTAAKTRQFNVKVSPAVGVDLAYNTEYFWRVKVFDSAGADSGWVTGTSFTTEQHLYPTANFTFNPSAPSQNEQVLFAETAQCFDINNNTASCPASDANYGWDFGCTLATCSKTTAIGKTATTTYADASSHIVTFTITDNEAFSCGKSQTVNLRLPLPKFRETAPKN